jgi:abortive infection bacteriophage resistance protein
MTYNRPWLSFQQQLDQLKSRGMEITDDAAALEYLERIGYYRLSGYWYPFRIFHAGKATDQFVEGTHFLDAVNLYLFDKTLRFLVLDALERIEISLRVDIAYLLGEKDKFAHIHVANFHPSFARKKRASGLTAFDEWVKKYRGLVSRSKEDFVRHYMETHGAELPVWVAIEVFDFGALSQLLSLMSVKDQQSIAAKYGINDWDVFRSWIYSLSYLRNLAAHHSRMWNRNNTSPPKMLTELVWCKSFAVQQTLLAKPFVLLAITRELVKQVCPNTLWDQRVKAHLLQFPTQLSDKN